jgi:hypothetical protein
MDSIPNLLSPEVQQVGRSFASLRMTIEFGMTIELRITAESNGGELFRSR